MIKTMKAKKSIFNEFVENTKATMNKYDFVSTSDGDKFHWYGNKLQTKYGNLFVKPDFENDSELLSIFCIFEDEIKSKLILKEWCGNLYSGKCNFHDYIPARMRSLFENFLKDCTR